MISITGGQGAGEWAALISTSEPRRPRLIGIFPKARVIEYLQHEMQSCEVMSDALPDFKSASFLVVELPVIAIGNWTRD